MLLTCCRAGLGLLPEPVRTRLLDLPVVRFGTACYARGYRAGYLAGCDAVFDQRAAR